MQILFLRETVLVMLKLITYILNGQQVSELHYIYVLHVSSDFDIQCRSITVFYMFTVMTDHTFSVHRICDIDLTKKKAATVSLICFLWTCTFNFLF